MHSPFLIFLPLALGSSLIVHSYPNISLVPEGYEMWATMSDNVNMYLMERDKVCEMMIDSENWLVYQVRYLWEPRGDWKHLVRLLEDQNATSVIPITCFWRKNGPNFVVRLDQHYSKLYLWNDETFDFTFDYDLMAWDMEANRFYIYINTKLFKLKVEDFIEIVRESELFHEKFAQLKFPLYQSKLTDWQDLMVVNGRIYFVHDGYIYQFENGTEVLLSRTFDFRHCTIYWENVENFNYVLNPIYETQHEEVGPIDDIKIVAAHPLRKRAKRLTIEDLFANNSTPIVVDNFTDSHHHVSNNILQTSVEILYILLIVALCLMGIMMITQGVCRLFY